MIEIKPLGDIGIQVSFGETINENIHREIQRFATGLRAAAIRGITEWVPAYCTVAIYYQPEVINYSKLIEEVNRIHSFSQCEDNLKPMVYEIPVYYGGESGPDLSFIANFHGLSEEEVIHLHSSREYLIYMMGFVPGFPYLGGLSPNLAVPRLEHPRSSIAAGSVGIGGNQTGIYPMEVPSGWRILGITPVTLVDFENSDPFLFKAGNYIKFNPISFDEFISIQQSARENVYRVRTYKKEKNNDFS